MSSNLKVNTILPSTGANVAIGTAGGTVTIVGNVDIDINSGISTFNDIHISDKIAHDGDTNTAIRFPAADTITFETNGGERFRITDAASSFTNKLIIDDGSNGHLFLNNTSSENTIHSGTTGFLAYKNLVINAAQHIFKVSNTEKLRIDSSGRVLINTTTTYPSNQMLYVKGGSPSTVYDGQAYLEGSETSGAINTGGTLVFGGHDGGTARTWGAIRTLKENGTSTNYASYMAFLTRPNGSAPTEKVRITSAGNVGIGEDDPSTTLHVENDNANASTYYLNTDAAILVQNKNSNATAKTVIKLEGPIGSGDCALVYGSGGGTNMIFAERQYERLRITDAGNVNIIDGNLIVANGHGIDFSATANGNGTNHNELLDDYEEGDWQPKVSSGGANWSTTARYTKVGRMVTIQADITNTSGSGTTEIHNLPFAVDSKYGTWHVGYAAVGGTTTAGNTNFTGGLIHFQGSGYLRARASGGTSNITMANNHRTIFTGIYYTT